MEEWRDLPGYEENYSVSSNGRVFGKRYKKNLNPIQDRYGYLYFCGPTVSGKRKKLKVHKCVMLAFVGVCPKGLQVSHEDGNCLNNKLGNLKYTTPKENMDKQYEHGTRTCGELVGMSKLNKNSVLEIRQKIKAGSSNILLAKQYGVHVSTIERIKSGKTWKHIDEESNNV